MMRKKYFSCILCLALFFHKGQAQIGIQTETPLAIFHVDPKKDTNPTGFSGTSDDFAITSTGNVGIGTIAPTEKLHINGTFRFRDGNQAENRVLISDALGNAKWGDRPKLNIIEVDDINSLLIGKTFTGTPSYSGISITLPEGSWQIMFQVTCTSTDNMYWDLSTSSTVYSLMDEVNRRVISSGYSPVSVVAIYFVKQSTEATYYIWANTRLGTATYLAGGTLWALPID